MSLCPRAAAQALHSPPELHQHEYKQHAAYFDPQDHPHYTLHPSSRFGADNEPLLESSAPSDDHPNIAGIRSPQSLHSLLACRLARLVSSAVAASSSSSSSSATGSSASSRPSRKRWLPALLLLNLAVTVAAFVAACVHFNTFTTLFLYLALLIVAFPIFSLTFLLLNSNSASYKLRLPQFSPFSSPTLSNPPSLLVKFAATHRCIHLAQIMPLLPPRSTGTLRPVRPCQPLVPRAGRMALLPALLRHNQPLGLR